MQIKDLIKARREELGLTYEALGKLVGVGKSTVRKWETGMIENMRRDNIIALSKALNISPSILMGWEDCKYESKSNFNPNVSVIFIVIRAAIEPLRTPANISYYVCTNI